MFLRSLGSFFIFLALSNALSAQTFTHFDEFTAYIKNVVRQQITIDADEEVEINIMQLDEKMKLPSCTDLIETSFVQQGVSSSSNTVILKCHKEPTWVLYIPLQIEVMTGVVIASRMIKPAEVFSKDDVIVQKRNKYQLQDGYFHHVEDVVGLVATRFIPAGGVLGKKNTRLTPLIKKNQIIALILKQGPIEIAMRGIAKSDGYMGDRVKILNPSSKKIVEGVVIASDKVVVDF